MAHRKLGKYEISERLGRGGMAEVYRAYHANLDRFVAIKVLHAFLADDPEFKSRFEKEARNIAKLKHSNIVQVYDFDYDEESESYYMVMELVEGATLKERLFKLHEQGKLLPVTEALRVVKQAAGALAYAHSLNMVHRDVKPGNLMLDRDDRVVLTDFGIAKIVTGAQFTSTGGMVGTPAYMAPEQGLGEPGDERADLYSLGVILFQLLTGRLPYDAETPLAVILKHLNEPVPSVRTLRPDLPPELDQLVLRLMSKDPTTRFQTAHEVIAEIEQLEATLDLSGLANSPIPKIDPAMLERSTPPPVLTPPPRASTPRPVSVGTVSPTEEPTTPAPTVAAAPAPVTENRRPSWPLALVALLVVAGVVVLLGNPGLIPGLGATATPTATVTALPPTDAPTEIAALVTEEPTASETPAPTETLVPTETPTDEPSATVTDMPTETATDTPSATATDLPPTETATDEPSATPTERPSATSTGTATASRTPSATASQTASVTASATSTATRTASRTPTVTRTPTASRTPTATRTASPTATASPSPTPRATATPIITVMPMLDVTQTLVQATRIVEDRQATQRACTFSYRIIDQIPADGDFFPTRSTYTRDITLRNTGTCAWERNTSLNFLSGESFSAGPRIFIREPVPVGQEVILRFEGRTPAQGGDLGGKWELRTPDLLPIGEPIDIRIFAYTR